MKKIIIDGHEFNAVHDPNFTKPFPFHGAFKSPMLVSEIPGHRGRIHSQDYVFVQPKLDGWCIMANTRTRKIYTRSGREITTRPHINKALPSGGPEWLHGEGWKAGANCDDVAKMVRLGDSSLEFHVFDCVSSDPFGLRYKEQLPEFNNDILYDVLTIQIRPDEIHAAYESFLHLGYEGMIIRLDGHGYEHRRSQNVFKMKPGTEGM